MSTARTGARGMPGYRDRLAVRVVEFALLAMAVAVGGSLFETLVIDPVWPTNIQVIQPDAGGLNRKVFWIPLHIVLTLALLVSLWLNWGHRITRYWLMAALALYIAVRIWTAVYFIPEALRFESMDEITRESMEAAKTWVRLSAVRSAMILLSFLALAAAVRGRLSFRPDIATDTPDLQRDAR